MLVSKKKKLLSVIIIFAMAVSIISGSQIVLGATSSAGVSTLTSQTTTVGTVTASVLNVRQSYNTKAKIIGTLLKGSNAYIITSTQGWYKITFNSTTGWIYGAYIANIRPVSTTSSSPVSTASSSSSSSPGVPASGLPAKIVAGYYTSWSAYSGFTPDKIKASMVNVVDYAFAGVGTDLKIAVGDPNIDYSNFTKLNTLKKSYPNLKTLISVGGWDGSSRFSDMALSDTSRQAFAQSCVTFIKQYGFDGVDIDWEYPVSGGSPGRPEDKTNFTLLMQTLRSALNKQGVADGRYYYLTFAGGASNGYINNVQLSQLAGYVDYAVDMTYDLHGPWDAYTDLNAPLYTPTETSPQYKISVDSSIQSWVSAGFPANKLVMGVPFYGYIYSGASSANNGLYQTFTSAQSIGYDSIAANYLTNSQFSKLYHSAAKVPYLYGNGQFISYDDAASITLKSQYASAKGLKGMSAWELSYDKNATLLGAVFNNLH